MLSVPSAVARADPSRLGMAEASLTADGYTVTDGELCYYDGVNSWEFNDKCMPFAV